MEAAALFTSSGARNRFSIADWRKGDARDAAIFTRDSDYGSIRLDTGELRNTDSTFSLRRGTRCLRVAEFNTRMVSLGSCCSGASESGSIRERS